MSKDQSKTVSGSMEETTDRHRRYLRAVNNPVRRDILRSMKSENNNIESISDDTGLDQKTVGWHLSVLIDGFCVEEKIGEGESRYVLTKEGLVVDYLDK